MLDQKYADLQRAVAVRERSVIVIGGFEAALTPLMLSVEARFAALKVFSLPSVDHPQWGRHIELGVKGDPATIDAGFAVLLEGLRSLGIRKGPELVR